jgi:hypothetical protein
VYSTVSCLWKLNFGRYFLSQVECFFFGSD